MRSRVSLNDRADCLLLMEIVRDMNNGLDVIIEALPRMRTLWWQLKRTLGEGTQAINRSLAGSSLIRTREGR